MTPDIAPAAATALWLGILTSISPCPLPANIAAVSYITRRVDRPRVVLLSAFAYSLGRALAYAAVSAVVVLGLLSVPGVSQFLQRYMNKLLGPLLVLVGMYLLGLLSAGLSTTAGSDELRKKAADGGDEGARRGAEEGRGVRGLGEADHRRRLRRRRDLPLGAVRLPGLRRGAREGPA